MVGKEGSSFLGEKAALVPKQCPGQPSVSPRKLGREWIEQQKMVLLGEDPNQNGDSRSLTLVGIGPSSNPPERGRGMRPWG